MTLRRSRVLEFICEVVRDILISRNENPSATDYKKGLHHAWDCNAEILLAGISTSRNLRIHVLVASIVVIYNLILRKCNSLNIVIHWSRVVLNRRSRIASIT